jgi:hypothetical protein|tara:strand:- start:621 stop:839 length:219 start_codon:yes stop_codon:yes gene_type:complete
MVLSDIMGFSESDYLYNQSRAHSADLFFWKVRAWFWGITFTLSFFLIGNIMGALGINIMGSITDAVINWWNH